jgi:hypothetical protein
LLLAQRGRLFRGDLDDEGIVEIEAFMFIHM